MMVQKYNDDETLKQLETKIGKYPDFPKKGILFRDIMPILADPKSFNAMIECLVRRVCDMKPDRLIGIESRGFLIGPSMALKLNIPFVPIRKKGKLPGDVMSVEYELEYGKDTLQVQKDSIPESSNCLIVDDLIATGGSLNAAKQLVEMNKSHVAGYAVIIELEALKGRSRLGNTPLVTLFSY